MLSPLAVLEVYQFARDSDAAEAWLVAQDAYLNNKDLGDNLDAVENLLKRHEAFEKAALAQEERFLALERLTTVRIYHTYLRLTRLVLHAVAPACACHQPVCMLMI